MNELVTVSIPTYKRSHWLRRAIQSVFSQTYIHWELIIVDDNGDNEFRAQTREAIGDLLRGNHRVRYLCHEHNRGLSAARNTGIFNARGKYIGFLDDDDEWLPEKLARQVDVFARGNPRLGLVSTGFWIIDELTNEKRVRTPKLRGNVHDRLGINHVGPPSQVLCRVEALQRIGGFDASFKARDDIEMYFRLSKQYEFDYVAEPLMNYYVHAGAMSQANPHKIAGFQMFLEKHGDDLRGRRKVLGEIYEALGETHVKHGNRAQGLQHLAMSCLHDPTSVGRYAKLALLLLGTGVFRAARRGVARAKRRYRSLQRPTGLERR